MTKMRSGFVVGLGLGLIAAAAVAALDATTQRASSSESAVRAVNLPGRTANLFSDAVMVGDTMYLAGRLGLVGGQPPATATEEARNVLDSIQSVLAEAGLTMDNLVQIQVFCSDVSFYGEFNEVYESYFGDRPPARAFVGSGDLLFGARFEVMGIAVRE